MDELLSMEREYKNPLLRKPPPVELINYRAEKSKLRGKELLLWNFWLDCQAWDSAGKVRLETVKEICGDYGLEYNKNIRGLILSIENEYRKAQR